MERKTALVTGGNRGLGLGFVKYLAENNFNVFASTRNLNKIPSFFKENKNIIPVEMDVLSDKSIKSAFELISSKFKSLDLLVNNAGVNSKTATNYKPELVSNLKNFNRKEILKVLNTNTVSPMMVIKEFLPILNANPSYIVNISSCRASFHDEYEGGYPNYTYAASKTALNMMTFRSIYELPKNVKIFAVSPGNPKTDMNKNGHHDTYTQAEKIVKITENWEDAFNGRFMNYDGEFYPL